MEALLKDLLQQVGALGAQLAAMRAEVAELRAPVSASAAPLGLAEACELAGVGSASAFYRWAAAHRVKPCGRGRWAREAIQAGLRREARGQKCAA